MSLKSFIKTIPKKIPLGMSVLGLIGLGLAIYSFYFERNPVIVFDVVAESNVLDIRQPLDDLAITFKGDDIQKSNQNLRIYKIAVSNKGKASVLQNYYDKNDIWGIGFKNAQLIEARLVGSNTNYILDNLKPKIIDGNLISFQKIIFDPNDYFTLDVLVLHPKNQAPEVFARGKIATVKSTTVVWSWLQKQKESFFDALCYGNLWIHMVRGVVSVFVFILFVALLIFIFNAWEKYTDKLKAEKRNKLYGDFLSTQNRKIIKRKFIKQIGRFYKSRGIRAIKVLCRDLEDNEELERKFKIKELEADFYSKKSEIEKERKSPSPEKESFPPAMPANYFNRYISIDSLIATWLDQEIIVRVDGKVTVNAIYQKFITDFLAFISTKDKT